MEFSQLLLLSGVTFSTTLQHCWHTLCVQGIAFWGEQRSQAPGQEWESNLSLFPFQSHISCFLGGLPYVSHLCCTYTPGAAQPNLKDVRSFSLGTSSALTREQLLPLLHVNQESCICHSGSWQTMMEQLCWLIISTCRSFCLFLAFYRIFKTSKFIEILSL